MLHNSSGAIWFGATFFLVLVPDRRWCFDSSLSVCHGWIAALDHVDCRIGVSAAVTSAPMRHLADVLLPYMYPARSLNNWREACPRLLSKQLCNKLSIRHTCARRRESRPSGPKTVFHDYLGRCTAVIDYRKADFHPLPCPSTVLGQPLIQPQDTRLSHPCLSRQQESYLTVRTMYEITSCEKRTITKLSNTYLQGREESDDQKTAFYGRQSALISAPEDVVESARTIPSLRYTPGLHKAHSLARS